MPYVNVKGRYRIYIHDGVEPLPFTSYSSSLCSIRRPNPNTFITISTYIPGSLSPFTTFDPGSSYTIVTRSNEANFTIGPYVRADRLPSSVTFRSPNFYHGLDKNSITVALSSYALSVNSPLSTAFTYIPDQNGFFVNSISFDTERFKQGLPSLLTHLTPNSSYQFKTRAPFTFFAPLQSEMGDAFAIGNNSGGEYGMGHRYSQTQRFFNTNGIPFVLSADQTFGIWDKMVFNNQRQSVTWNSQTFLAASLAALSSCGSSKALFVLGSNLYGQLGTGSSQQYYPTWTKVGGQWLDVEMGARHMLATNTQGHLYSCGINTYGQLGLGSGVSNAGTLTLVDNTKNYVQLAATTYSTSVRDANGAIYSCGDNSYGQLGINSTATYAYALTRESTNTTWSSIKTIKGTDALIALQDGALFGCGYSEYLWGGGAGFQRRYFSREALAFTDITDFYTTGLGTFIKRQGQDYLFAAGENSTSFRLATLSSGNALYFTKTTIPSNVRNIFNYYSFTSNGLYNLGYIGSDFFVYAKGSADNVFTQKQFQAFDVFSCNGGGGSGVMNPVFLLNNNSNLRSTPTPTPTITPTMTPTPTITPTTSRPYSAPYNTLQVGLFGSSFQLNSSNTSYQVAFNNTPGNLSNNFALETINSGSIPPGATVMTTFDFEKTTTFNNIVGISVIQQYNQNPSGREFCRYLYRKSGSTWTYTLLPASFDADSKTNIYIDYRTSETGADNLFITPPHPQYAGTGQGIYFLMFIRDETFYEAISYNRGSNWAISPFFGPLGSSQYFGLDQNGMCKIIYSRTRGIDYEVHAVGFAQRAVDSMPYNSLYFSKRFPNSTAKETISSISNAWGFDFKHDYYNIPTVVSYVIDRDSPGKPSGDVWGRLLIHRKIGNSWQTDIIKAAISTICIGPYYQVPAGLSVYKRLNSPSMSIEFDSTNPDLIYVAHLLSRRDVVNASNDPMYINVLCYNMRTKSIVFDENVIKARSSVPGSYLITLPTGTTSGGSADIPTLYFDTADNTLNLFFVSCGAQATASMSYFKTKRLGANSWSAVTNVSTGSVRPFITGSRELKIKY